jgi:hypothetical protein
MRICSSKILYRKNQFNKVLNLTPKIHSNSPPFKGEGRKWRDGKGKKGKRGEGRRGSILKILRLQHWKYSFAPMAPLPLGLAAYTGLHSPIVILHNCNIQYSKSTYTPLTPMDAVLNLKKWPMPIPTHIKLDQ